MIYDWEGHGGKLGFRIKVSGFRGLRQVGKFSVLSFQISEARKGRDAEAEEVKRGRREEARQGGSTCISISFSGPQGDF